MTAITTCLHNEPQYVRLVEEVARGRRSLYLHGMVKESTGLFLLSLSENLNRPVFVVSENIKRSMELADEMRSVAEGRAVVFPEEKSRFFSVDSVDCLHDHLRITQAYHAASKICRSPSFHPRR